MKPQLYSKKPHTHLVNQNIGLYINRDFVSLQLNDPIDKALGLLMRDHAANIPVLTAKGKMAGTITYPVIIEALRNGIDLATEVSSIMSKDFLVFHEGDTFTKLQQQVAEPYPVINKKGQVLGVLDPKNIMKQLLEAQQHLQSLEQMIELYEFCFDTAYEGVTVVDSQGYIKLFNESYARFTGVNKEEAIGKHCTEVIEMTRLPVVLETGIPERNQPHFLQGQSMIVNRLPIWKGNKIIGAVGMLIFEGVSELYETFNRAQQYFNKGQEAPAHTDYPPFIEKYITFDQILGESISLGEAKKIARKAAKTTATILVTGESGVGKELFAQAIHNASPVKNGPMITLNCAAIPADLLESELFGYEAGAFTGAKKGGKPGKFELAHEGTLFLDEIGEMSLDLQTKLLRVLQEQRFERVGGIGEVSVNVRVIAATNKSLEKQIKKGEFREDLYYRINVIPVVIPPLRKRKTDIPLLVSKMLADTCKRYKLPAIELCKEAMEALIEYNWPGNVRELSNVIERVVVLAEGKRVRVQDLPEEITQNQLSSEFEPAVKGTEPSFMEMKHQISFTKDMQEKDLIINILKEVDGNKTKAARKLGMHRTTLYNKLKKYKLN